jgi:DNA mismatch repair protein MutL
MTIDTNNGNDKNGWQIDCNTGEIKPSEWEIGTRMRVRNLFAKTPARLKFLRGDRAELMSVLDVVKKLAMARTDVGFVLNDKWVFPKNQDLLSRISAVMGEDVVGRMLEVDAASVSTSGMKLTGYISEPTLRRASSVDQYLFVNGRPVKDKVLVSALRAAYMDVMHAREFPLCALYLWLPTNSVDVNVSPAKTEVHFLEPTHVRSFIIKTLRDRLAQTMVNVVPDTAIKNIAVKTIAEKSRFDFGITPRSFCVRDEIKPVVQNPFSAPVSVTPVSKHAETPIENVFVDMPLGRVVGQVANKYIIAQKDDNMVIVDQHAAHERITYEKLRSNKIKTQPLLTPIIVNLREEDVVAIMSITDELKQSGLHIDAFGDDAIAIFEKPADWDLDWNALLKSVADEVRVYGHSSQLNEKLHLKLANYACHHSVRAGQKLDLNQMDVLLRDV